MVDLQVIALDGQGAVLNESQVAEFQADLRGPLIQPGDDTYDEQRQVWNGNVDKRPALIARCAGVADVITCVNFARENNLLVSVRGGAHSFAGTAVCDGGLVIDLSLMKGIRVNPKDQTVRAEGGVKWGEFDHETQAFGLATTGGTVADTGIGGLTLGGGHGWLCSKYGLVSDNLISADIVTADGRLLEASETENTDLFWGIRAGGGNFGVATTLEFKLYSVGQVLAGLALYSFDQAREVLRFYRDFSKNLPDELNTASALLTSPEGDKMVGIVVCYNGPIGDGERAIEPVRKFGPPVADQIRPMAYAELQGMLDEVVPPRRQYYEKAQFLSEISDQTIDILIDHFSKVTSPLSIPFLQQTGGAMQRGDTAYGHRDALYNLILIASWEDPGESEIHVKWTRDLWEALQPHSTGGVYVNNIGGESQGDGDLVRAAYGASYPRLAEVKKKYDPTNLFRHNQNIKP